MGMVYYCDGGGVHLRDWAFVGVCGSRGLSAKKDTFRTIFMVGSGKGRATTTLLNVIIPLEDKSADGLGSDYFLQNTKFRNVERFDVRVGPTSNE